VARHFRSLALLLVLAGCKASLGEMASHTLQVPASDDMRLIQIQLPVSDSFTVLGGAKAAMEATVSTNVPDLAPKSSENGNLRKFVQRLPSGRTLPDGARNDWNIRLGATTPLLLDIGAGVLKGDMSLGGLKLVGLNLGVGVNAPTVHFDAPNLTEMQEITISAGTGECRLAGLSRTHVRKLKVDGGAGALHLDFAGTLEKSATAEVKGGVGAVTLVIPATVAARLQVETGVGSVSVPGYAVSGNTYTSPGFADDKPHWDIDLAVGVGAVTVKTP
jgi:hypothetical protein